MRGRGENVGKLERELAALRTSIEETEAERARQSELAAAADTDKRAAAEDPAVREEAKSRAASHREEQDRLGDVLVLRRKALVEFEARLEQARYDGAYGTLEKAAERRGSASASLSKALAATIEAGAVLEAERGKYDVAKARCRELLPADVDFEEGVDEVEWPEGLDRLVELIQKGPRRARAELVTSLAEIERHARQAQGAEVFAAVEAAFQGDYERLERLQRDLRPRVPGAAQSFADRILEDIELRARQGEVLDQEGMQRNLARHRATIAGKVEKILAAVGETESVEVAA